MAETAKKPVNKGLIAVIIVLAIAVAACLVYFVGIKPNQGKKTITVEINHLDTDTYANRTLTIKTDAEFVRGALEEENLISGSDSEYGLWVTTVDGETANSDNEEWWGYDINGTMAELGVDSQPIADGDTITWTMYVGY